MSHQAGQTTTCFPSLTSFPEAAALLGPALLDPCCDAPGQAGAPASARSRAGSKMLK